MSNQKSGKKWNYKQWTILTRGMCLVGAFFLLGRLFTGYAFLAIPGVIFLFPGLIIAAFTLNCPHCGKLIGDLLTHNASKCPHCNKPIEPIFEKKKK